MARPKKNNAEYHSHDADMRNDIKIKALRRKYKLTGYAVFNMMLEVLTNSEHFKYDWNDFNIELLSGDFEIEPDLLKEIIDYCTNVVSLFTIENGKIFSYRHKERFSNLLSKRERQRTGVIANDNPHSKGKNSKVEETKEKESLYDFLKFRESCFEKYDDKFKSKLLNDFKIEGPLIYHTGNHHVPYADLVELIYQSVNDNAWLMNLKNQGYQVETVSYKLTIFVKYLLDSQAYKVEKYKSHHEFQKHFYNKELKK
ncbi:MAG: DUF4373 domain-containing protein [Chitinophagales bacterium]